MRKAWEGKSSIQPNRVCQDPVLKKLPGPVTAAAASQKKKARLKQKGVNQLWPVKTEKGESCRAILLRWRSQTDNVFHKKGSERRSDLDCQITCSACLGENSCSIMCHSGAVLIFKNLIRLVNCVASW